MSYSSPELEKIMDNNVSYIEELLSATQPGKTRLLDKEQDTLLMFSLERISSRTGNTLIRLCLPGDERGGFGALSQSITLSDVDKIPQNALIWVDPQMNSPKTWSKEVQDKLSVSSMIASPKNLRNDFLEVLGERVDLSNHDNKTSNRKPAM